MDDSVVGGRVGGEGRVPASAWLVLILRFLRSQRFPSCTGQMASKLNPTVPCRILYYQRASCPCLSAGLPLAKKNATPGRVGSTSRQLGWGDTENTQTFQQNRLEDVDCGA